MLDFLADRSQPALGLLVVARDEAMAFGLERLYAALDDTACVGCELSRDGERAEVCAVAPKRPLEHAADVVVWVVDDHVGGVAVAAAGQAHIHRSPAGELVDQTVTQAANGLLASCRRDCDPWWCLSDLQSVPGSSFVRRLRARVPAWVWFISLAFACGVAIVVVALTLHNRCEESDPSCVFHSYTLVQDAGPGVLSFVGAPVVISLVVAALLHMKVTRRSHRADRAAWLFAMLSCLICLVGLVVEGIVMLPEAALIICAVATAPLPPDPRDPLARRGGYSQPPPTRERM